MVVRYKEQNSLMQEEVGMVGKSYVLKPKLKADLLKLFTFL